MGTPMKAPGIPQRKLQKNTANSTRNGEIARVAPDSNGSKITADQELDDAQSGQDDQRHLYRLELCGGKKGGENNRYKRPEEWNVIQNERYHAPGNCEIQPDKKREAESHEPGQKAPTLRMSMYFRN